MRAHRFISRAVRRSGALGRRWLGALIVTWCAGCMPSSPSPSSHVPAASRRGPSGGLAWEVPGLLRVDPWGRLFDVGGSDWKFSRLDATSGRPSWTANGYVLECTYGETLLARSRARIAGTAPSDGSVRWTIELEKALGRRSGHCWKNHRVDEECRQAGWSPTASVHCPRQGGGFFFLGDSDHRDFVDAYSVETGARLWRYEYPAHANPRVFDVLGVSGGVVVFRYAEAGPSETLEAVELASGRRLWARTWPTIPLETVLTASGWLLRFEAQHGLPPRPRDPGTLHRIDLSTGAVLWTYAGKPRERGAPELLVTGAEGLARLDPGRGRPLWSFAAGGFDPQRRALSELARLPDGRLIGNFCDDDLRASRCELVALGAATGAVHWRRPLPAHRLAADDHGHVFSLRRSGELQTLSLHDPASGAIIWQHDWPENHLRNVMMHPPSGDRGTVYLTLSDINHKFPIHALVALDLRTGARRWSRPWSTLVGMDADRVYLQEGGSSGTTPFDERRPLRIVALWR